MVSVFSILTAIHPTSFIEIGRFVFRKSRKSSKYSKKCSITDPDYSLDLALMVHQFQAVAVTYSHELVA